MTSATTAELNEPLQPGTLRTLAQQGPLDRLLLHGKAVLTVRRAAELRRFSRVDNLRLWSRVSRAAVREALATPGLRVLEILELGPSGQLAGLEQAATLESLHCFCGLQASDFEALAGNPRIRQFTAHDFALDKASVDALLQMPALDWLTLEDCGFSDELAARLKPELPLRSLFLPHNPLGHDGLRHIVKLRHLRELDLWQTFLQNADFERLQELPQLEYLSLGQSYEPAGGGLDAAVLLPLLSRLPALRRLELDGFALDDALRAAYAARFEQVRILDLP